MAGNIIMVDTAVLIDYFRKTDKSNSKLISLIKKGYIFNISSITAYEIYAGSTHSQQSFCEELLEKTVVISFDKQAAKIAVEINNELKRKSNQIAIADLFIVSTAVSNNIPFATLNRKHFDRIDILQIID